MSCKKTDGLFIWMLNIPTVNYYYLQLKLILIYVVPEIFISGSYILVFAEKRLTIVFYNLKLDYVI